MKKSNLQRKIEKKEREESALSKKEELELMSIMDKVADMGVEDEDLVVQTS